LKLCETIESCYGKRCELIRIKIKNKKIGILRESILRKLCVAISISKECKVKKAHEQMIHNFLRRAILVRDAKALGGRVLMGLALISRP